MARYYVKRIRRSVKQTNSETNSDLVINPLPELPKKEQSDSVEEKSVYKKTKKKKQIGDK